VVIVRAEAHLEHINALLFQISLLYWKLFVGSDIWLLDFYLGKVVVMDM